MERESSTKSNFSNKDQTNTDNQIQFGEYTIFDKKSLQEHKKNNFTLTQEGHFTREVNLNKKCHCNSSKKYKNCCSKTDILGYYDSQSKIFYCDLMEFLTKFQDKLETKKVEEKETRDFQDMNNCKNTNNSNTYNKGKSDGLTVEKLSNQFEKIYI